MDTREILAHTDHTLLAPDCTAEQIKALCDEAVMYGTASVCIPPLFVKTAKEYIGDKMKVCTVIGFPNGYNTAEVKAFEAENAINDGADEIDTVINIGAVKEGRLADVESEIRLLKNICGNRVLKVIIEACLLTDAEKKTLCKAVANGGADYIKTSTGFSKGGATLADIKLMKENVPPTLKIKAAGGISTLEDASAFLKAGADRLGSSKIMKLCKEIFK